MADVWVCFEQGTKYMSLSSTYSCIPTSARREKESKEESVLALALQSTFEQ